MKLRLKTNLYLIVGAILMANFSGCSGYGIKFEKYYSSDPAINISMDYISGWKYSESRGSYDSYAQVMFYPFGKENKSSKTVMVMTVKDSSKIGLSPLTVKTVVEDLLAKRMQFKDAKILSKSKRRLFNTQTTVIELSYRTLENLLRVDSKMILVKEKIIIFQKGKSFYFLRYQNSAEEFDRFSKAFSHVVSSLKLKK